MSTACATGLSTATAAATAGRTAARDALDGLGGEEPILCQVFSSSTYDPEPVVEAVRDVLGTEPALIGCVSTGEFTERETADHAVAVGLVASDELTVTTGVGTGLSENVTAAVRSAVAPLPIDGSEYPYQSAITLHDGLTGLGERLALVLQRKLGPDVSVAGGSASDNYALESTPVFCDGRVVEDGIVVAYLESERRLSVSVDHGHEPISEPMTVTDSDGNVVHAFDGTPALDAWLDVVGDRARERFGVDPDELTPGSEALVQVMGEFEFGVDQGDGYKVRWPQVVGPESRSLKFAVDVPAGTVMRVMHGHPDDQIESARRTARAAVEGLDGPPAGGFVYDCSCREIILGDRFGEAVAAIDAEVGAPFCGFETYGETCLRKGQMSGFHNTTTVMILFPE